MWICKPGVKAASAFFFVVSLVFGPCLLAQGGTIVIKPGQFDHFTVQVPERILAGEDFIVKVQAFDANNNLITNFQESGKEFRVEVSDSATVQPSSLNPASFPGGTANVSVNSKKAERVVFSIRETGGTVPVISKELTALPNKLDHFYIQTQASVVAGTPFDIRVIAKDFFGNTVNDLDIGRDIKINFTGTISLKIMGNSNVDFKNGIATLNVVSEKTGIVSLELQEMSTGSRGKTENITIIPAALSYFKVQTPKNVVAGEAFELLVVAYDSYGNIITNYSTVGNGVMLTSTGNDELEPSFVGASDFKQGQVVVKGVYDKAAEIQIVAREVNREQSGRSGDILVVNSVPDHFIVVTPDSGISGQKFKIKVEAYDRFNNLIKDYNLVGNDVLLTTSGTGIILPTSILPSDFSGGVAVEEISYDKAESFLISASMAMEKIPGRMTMKDQEKKQEAQVHKITEKSASAVHESKVEKPVHQEVKPKAGKTLEKITSESPAKKEAKSLPYAIKDVTLIEGKNKEMIVLNFNGSTDRLEYSDEIASRDGKEWLKIQMKPAVIKIEKSFKFMSAFVGEVQLEEAKDGGNVLSAYIELTPSGITYDIARIKNTLVITLSNRL